MLPHSSAAYILGHSLEEGQARDRLGSSALRLHCGNIFLHCLSYYSIDDY